MEYFKTIFNLSVYLTKRFLKDKVALFFTFVFPLVFLFIFGGLFRNSNASFNIAVINNSSNEFATSFVEEIKKQDKTFKIKDVVNFDDAETKLGRSELDSIVELPSDFGAIDARGRPSGKIAIYYKESDAQTGQTFASVMDGILNGINKEFITEQPPLTLESKSLATANLSQFDYTFSGLLGFSLLSMGIFSMANGFTGDKKEGSLRRLKTTPLRPSQMILATGLNRLFIGLLVVAVMFAVAMGALSYRPSADIISLIWYVIFSISMLFGFGMAVSGWAKNENQAAPLANLVSFPMMFLSGSFFPRFLMPQWLQNISDFLPLTPVIDGLRYILTESKTLFDLGPQLAIIAVWTVVIYIIAFKTFRWE